MSERMRSERKAIAEHQENKVDNIQSELTIQLLSFTGLTIAFGIGFALSERFHPDNPATLEGYGLPSTKNIPAHVTRLYVEDPLERGPFGAKSMAEHPGISLIPAIINGVANATGVRVMDIPATPERILDTMKGVAAE